MPEGIELCKINITEFLRDAKRIIKNTTLGYDYIGLSHAYISVQFAVEELGKILILRDKLKDEESDPVIIKYEEAFKYHDPKTDKALTFLGEEFKRLYDGGIFEKGCVEKGVRPVVEDTYVTHETRLDCTFVDYYADHWQLGRIIKKNLLVKLMKRIEERLPDA